MGVIRRVITVTPVLAVAGAYGANDQVGLVNTLANACANTGGTVEIESLSVIDKAKQSKAFDLLFFDVLPVLDVIDNGAFSMSNARMAAGYKGHISVAAADYITSANATMANPKNQKLLLKAIPASKSLYCVVVARGTPTYANGDLVINVGITQGER